MNEVLICTEEGILALYLRNILQREGYSVAGYASSASAAVNMAKTCRPDLILMDTYFTDSDGIQAAREITDNEWRPILLLSECQLDEDASGSLPGGACDYLQQPFSREQLLRVINRLKILYPSARASVSRQRAQRIADI